MKLESSKTCVGGVKGSEVSLHERILKQTQFRFSTILMKENAILASPSKPVSSRNSFENNAKRS